MSLTLYPSLVNLTTQIVKYQMSKMFAKKTNKFLELNFNRFYRSLEQFFVTLGQNNFGNKLPFLINLKC